MKEVFGTSNEIDLQMAIGLLEENNINTSVQEIILEYMDRIWHYIKRYW